MKKNHKGFGLALVTSLLLSGSVQSATEINSTRVMSFSLSNTGLTRISIENDGIKDIFAYPGTVLKSLNLHPSGNLFVAPAGLTDPIYVTVISHNGATQDLKLSFVTKAPKPLLLKIKTQQRASKDQIERWMSVALMGEAPRHFRRESPLRQKIRTASTLAHECARFSNGIYSLSLWDVRSTVDKPVSITADLYIDPSEAGKLSDIALPPKGTTKLVIISKNQERKK